MQNEKPTVKVENGRVLDIKSGEEIKKIIFSPTATAVLIKK
jgi:hypothetical protein